MGFLLEFTRTCIMLIYYHNLGRETGRQLFPTTVIDAINLENSICRLGLPKSIILSRLPHFWSITVSCAFEKTLYVGL